MRNGKNPLKNVKQVKTFHNLGRSPLNLSESQKRIICDFNKKVLNKEIAFEQVPCLCQNNDFALVASVDRYGLLQSTVLCQHCGLIQSNPRMTADQYRSFYESDDYRRLYDGENFARDFNVFYENGHGLSIFRTIAEHKPLKEIKNALEIGAGGGWNLLPFIREGITVKGYDLSRELVHLGWQKGIDLTCGNVGDIEGTYDLIIANHVIEHFTDFLSEMKTLKAHLNDNGMMYVAVPDIRQFSLEQLQNAHIYYFTPETLKCYLGQCGLTMVHCQPEPGGHMSCILICGNPHLKDDFLKGHYEATVKKLKQYRRSYYPRKLVVGMLGAMGLAKRVKRIKNRHAGQ